MSSYIVNPYPLYSTSGRRVLWYFRRVGTPIGYASTEFENPLHEPSIQDLVQSIFPKVRNLAATLWIRGGRDAPVRIIMDGEETLDDPRGLNPHCLQIFHQMEEKGPEVICKIHGDFFLYAEHKLVPGDY